MHCYRTSVPARRLLRLPRLHDDISEACFMLEHFENINQAFTDWASKVDGALEAWIVCAGSDAKPQSSETFDRIKSELRPRIALGSSEDDCGFPYLGCLAQISLTNHYFSKCGCQSTGKVWPDVMLYSAPMPAPSVSTTTSLSSDVRSTQPNIDGSCVDEDRATMFASYAGPLPINPC